MRQKCLFFFVLMCLFVGLSGCDRGGKSRSGNDANREVSSSSSSSGSSDESGSDAFRMLLDIKETDLEISFYVKGDNDINIDWGDGNRNTVYGGKGGAVEHTYATSGRYEVSITGLNKMGFFVSGELGAFDPLDSCGEKLREVKSWGGVEWDSTEYMFLGCSNLTTLPSEAPDLSKVEYMSGMFWGATKFDQPLNDWGEHLGRVKGMSYMFYGATNFNQPLDKWGKHLGNVKDMSYMFDGATKFNQPLNDWGENLYNVLDMSYMFYGATNFDQALNHWGEHLGNVKDMSGMFWGATKFNQPLDKWGEHLGKVVNMSYMFAGATNFNQPLDKWGKHLGNVKDVSGMFWGATKFDQPLNNWGEHLGRVEHMSYMFAGATNFNHPLDKWGAYLGRVNDMEWMFWGAGKFTHNIDNWVPHVNVKLDNFIHKNSTYVINNNNLPHFCRGRFKEDSNESVCLSDTPYMPKESETAQSPEPAEGD